MSCLVLCLDLFSLVIFSVVKADKRRKMKALKERRKNHDLDTPHPNGDYTGHRRGSKAPPLKKRKRIRAQFLCEPGTGLCNGTTGMVIGFVYCTAAGNRPIHENSPNYTHAATHEPQIPIVLVRVDPEFWDKGDHSPSSYATSRTMVSF
jgi:hypothetical protein